MEGYGSVSRLPANADRADGQVWRCLCVLLASQLAKCTGRRQGEFLDRGRGVADLQYPNATTTNVAGWGQPGANLTTPSCKKDFANHVIVFNMAFCGD